MAPLLVRARVTGDPLAPVETLDGVVGQPHIYLTLDQLMGHRLIVTVDRHVVINVDPRLLPLGVDIGLCRQGLKRRPVPLLEVRLAATGQLTERSGIERHQQFADGGIERQQREELAVTQRR